MTTRSDLYAFLQKMEQPKGWVVHIHLSALEKILDAPRMRDVTKMLQPFETARAYRLFYNNAEAFLYVPATCRDDRDAFILKLQFRTGLHFSKEAAFYTIYDLQTQSEKLKKLLNTELPTAPSAHVTETATVLQEATQKPLTPAVLAQIEKALTSMDLSNIIRRQPVCALVGKAPPLTLFEEVYVAINELIKTLYPNTDVSTCPWLLQHLTETLDKRVLENIGHHDGGAYYKNFSINLSVKSLTSDAFLAFDNSLDSTYKETIWLEIRQSDMWTNLPLFLKARDMIRAKRYRLCLDEATFDSLALIDREKLGVDMIKVVWDEALLTQQPSASMLHNINPERLILCRTDDTAAIEFGQKLHVMMFQGYAIQKLLYKSPKTRLINRV